MMRVLAFISLFLPLLSSTLGDFYESKDLCEDAYKACDFYFDGYKNHQPIYDICSDSPDNGPGFSDQILARNGDTIGTMNSNGPCEYLSNYVSGSFSQLNYLDSELSLTQFRPYSDSGVPRIGHETFQGDSRDSVKGRCIKVPFSGWQVLDSNGNIINNATGNTDTSCIVFEVGYCYCYGLTQRKALHIEAADKAKLTPKF